VGLAPPNSLSPAPRPCASARDLFACGSVTYVVCRRKSPRENKILTSSHAILSSPKETKEGERSLWPVAGARARAPLRVAGILPALLSDENGLSDTDSHGFLAGNCALTTENSVSTACRLRPARDEPRGRATASNRRSCHCEPGAAISRFPPISPDQSQRTRGDAG